MVIWKVCIFLSPTRHILNEHEMKKLDLENIIDYSIRFAQHMLTNGGEFYPFGTKVLSDGELVPVGIADEESDFPNSMKLIEKMNKVFKLQYEKEEIRAYSIVFDVYVQIDDQGDKSDAICIDIIHKEGDVPLYYFPYSINEQNEILMGQSFGMIRE